MSSSLKTDVINTLNSLTTIRYNAILKDLIIMSLLLVSSLLIIGIPLSIFYLLYESFSWGFITLAFLNTFKIKGIGYILLHLLFNKLLTFILMLIFIKKIITISRLSIGLRIYKNDSFIKEKISHNFINSLYIIVFVLVINVFVYFLSPIFFSLLK